MVSISCWKCKQTFKDSKRLQSHKVHCKGRAEALQQVLAKGQEVAARSGQLGSRKIAHIEGVAEGSERQDLRELEQIVRDTLC